MKKWLLILSLMLMGAVNSTVFAQPLSGDYYIPQGSNPQGFASLGAAVTALNSGGCSGTVRFYIDGDLTQAAGSALAITRNDLNATNNLIIKPAPGKSPVVTFNTFVATSGAIQYAAFSLSGASYITFDGSNTEGGTTRDMTFKINDGTNGKHAVTLFGNCDNITVKNMIFSYTAISAGSQNNAPVYVNGQTSGAADNFLFQNNLVGSSALPFYYGVRATGSSTAPGIYCTNLRVKDNELYGIIRTVYGFYVGDASSPTEISGNIISNTSTTASGFVIYGILLNTYKGVTNIFNNKIVTLKTNNASAQGLYGISTLTAGAGSSINIYNNFIGDFYCLNAATNTTPVYGIYFQDASTSYVYQNTISMSPVNNTTAAVAAIRTGSTAASTVKNNIIINGYNTAASYGIYHGSSGALTSNYNAMYVSGALANYGFATSAKKTFADWQGTGRDANSISADPALVSGTDLHISDDLSPVIGIGATDLGIATDIDGNSRGSAFDIGADEFLAGTAPSAPNATAATSVTASGFTANWDASSGATKYRLDVSTTSDFSTFVSGYQSLNVGNVVTYAITGLLSSTTYYYRVRSSNGNTSTYSNVITVSTTGSAPDAPVATAATNVSNFSFSANWDAASGATSYYLDVATTSDFQTGTFATGFENKDVGNVVTYSVTGLSDDVTYYYRVRAFNGLTSGNSNTITVTTVFLVTPDVPVVAAPTSIATHSFAANWAAATNATSYKLDVATDNTFTSFVTGYNNLDVGNVTTYTVSGLNYATNYYYRVRGFNGKASANSSTQLATTAPQPVFSNARPYLVGTNPETENDYETLKAACDALTDGVVTGNVTFLITSSLTETAHVSLGVNTAGYTVTFKPYTGIQPTINFTQTSSNTVFGLWVIGTNSLGASYAAVPTNNIIIDGSNVDGGTSRDLTITNADNATTSYYGIRIVGNSDNCVIKNINLTATETGTGSSYGLVLSPLGDAIPDNGIIENNLVNMSTCPLGQAVAITPLSNPTAGNAVDGTIIRNNTLTSRTRGIFVNYGKNLQIYGNTVTLAQSSPGYYSQGIYFYNNSSASAAGTCAIYNNSFNSLTTANTSAANGVVAIAMECAGTYNIYNNIITGFNPTSASAVGMLMGLRINTASAVTANIYYNTVVINEVATQTGSDAGGIAALNIASNFTGTANVKNNIFIVRNNPASYGIYRAGSTGTVVSDYNNIYTPGTNGKFGYWNGTAYATRSAWNAATSQDANSASGDVTFVSATDLRLSGTSIGDPVLRGTPISGYTTDIDGETRNATYPYKGVDENLSSILGILAMDITALIEARTSSTTGQMAVDTIYVSLMKGTAPYTTVDQVTAVVDADGFASLTFPLGRLSTDFYVKVTHRNALETWSAAPVNFSSYSGNAYNFTTAQNKAHGDNLVQVGSKWCLYSGDVNADGAINNTDITLVGDAAAVYATGVQAVDIDGDSLVDFTDLKLIDNQAQKNLAVSKPSGAEKVKVTPATQPQAGSEKKQSVE